MPYDADFNVLGEYFYRHNQYAAFCKRFGITISPRQVSLLMRGIRFVREEVEPMSPMSIIMKYSDPEKIKNPKVKTKVLKKLSQMQTRRPGPMSWLGSPAEKSYLPEDDDPWYD